MRITLTHSLDGDTYLS